MKSATLTPAGRIRWMTSPLSATPRSNFVNLTPRDAIGTAVAD
jgi:hypothetical protein